MALSLIHDGKPCCVTKKDKLREVLPAGMPREHGESGEFVETTTLDDVLAVIDAVDGPVVLSADVADHLGCSRETARRKLKALHDRGELACRKVARRVIYWRPDPAATVADAEVRGSAETTLDDTDPVERIPTEDLTDSADESGREPGVTPTEGQADALDAVEFPRERSACVAAVDAAAEYIREHGSATMRELVADVMPAHPVGYDVPDLSPGDRYRGAWWRKVVKPGLEAREDVEKPPRGGSKWRWVGDA